MYSAENENTNIHTKKSNRKNREDGNTYGLLDICFISRIFVLLLFNVHTLSANDNVTRRLITLNKMK